ncbi:MAG: tetratricopeptide repeat protein [Opitutales bacterium]
MKFSPQRWKVYVLVCVSALLGLGNAGQAPNSLLVQSEQLYQEREYDRARSLLERARERYPNDPRLYYNQGVLEFEQGNFQEAAVLFGQSRARARDDRLFAQATAQMANAYVRLGEASLAAGQTDQAESNWWHAHSSYRSALDADAKSVLAAANAPVTEQAFFDLYLHLADRSIEASGIHRGIEHFNEDSVQALKSALVKLDQADLLRAEHPEVEQRRALIHAALSGLLRDLAKDNYRKAENYVLQDKWAAAESPAQNAVDAYKDALEFAPDNDTLRQELEQSKALLADIKNRLGELKRASADNVARQQNAHPMAEPHLLKEAIEQFEGALENKPEFARAERNLEQARQRLSELLEQRGDASQQTAEQNQQDGQGAQPNEWYEALRHFRRAQDFNPSEQGRQRQEQKAQKAEQELLSALKQAGQQQLEQSQQELDPEKAMAQMDQALQYLSQANNMEPGNEQTEQMLSEAEKQWREMRAKMEAFRQMQMAQAQQPGGKKPGRQAPGGFTESVAFAEGEPSEGDASSERWAKFNTRAMQRPVRDW